MLNISNTPILRLARTKIPEGDIGAWKQHPAAVHTKCCCFVWSGLCLFALHSPGWPGTSCLCSLELGLEVCSTITSCLSPMLSPQPGLPGGQDEQHRTQVLHKQQLKKGKQWLWQPSCFREATRCVFLSTQAASQLCISLE